VSEWIPFIVSKSNDASILYIIYVPFAVAKYNIGKKNGGREQKHSFLLLLMEID
jgi:hypothetical protein